MTDYNVILRYATRLLADSAAAEDVTQEAFLRFDAHKADVQNERSWLYRTTRNLVIDHYRKIGRMQKSDNDVQTLPDGATLCDPAKIIEQKELIQMLHENINELSLRHREAIRLKFQEGLTYSEIAEIMGEPISTVGFLLHDAIAKLRKAMT